MVSYVNRSLAISLFIVCVLTCSSFVRAEAGSSLLFFDDMESGTSKWTSQSPWGLVTNTYDSPTHCWHDSPSGNYSNSRNISLTTFNALNLAGYTDIYLEFETKYAFESCCDYGYVEVSTNSGSSWTRIGTMSGTQSTWTTRSYALDAYAGQTILIRFRFISDGSVTYDGWYIDDVRVSANPIDDLNIMPVNDFVSTGNNGGPFTPSSFVYTLANTGSSSLNWTASLSQAWVAVSPTSGTLAPGASLSLEVALNAQAAVLPSGSHNAVLTIINVGTGMSQVRAVELGVGIKRILAFTQFADIDQEYLHTLNAISSVSTNYIVNTVSDASQLPSQLPGYNILLIPEPESADPSTMVTIGTTHKILLQNFVNNGGVIIQCDVAGKYGLLTAAELMSISGSSTSNGYIVDVIGSSDPIAEGVAATYIAQDATSAYTTTEESVVCRRTGVGPVVINKEYGSGNVVLIGHDYYASNEAQDRLLGNAVFNLPSIRDDLVIDAGRTLFTGYPGGPFTPAEAVYTLTNRGSEPLQWSCASNVPWLDAVPEGGLLETGQSIPVIISINAAAEAFALGSYTGQVIFSNIGNGVEQSRWIQLDVIPEQYKLLADDGVSGDYFGYSTAIDGDLAIVGAYRDDDRGTDSGSAYIYQWTGENWVQQAKLTASDGYASDYFGFSVSISGDTAVIGAYQDDDKGSNSGSVYVFRKTGGLWTQQAKLTASDGYASDYFGYSVAVDGNTIVVGSYQDDDKGSNSGSAYVFQRSGEIWTQQTKLTALDGYAGDYFGWCVAIDAATICIGASQDDDKGTDSGSAYIFYYTGAAWVQQSKLVAADGYSQDYFGFSVSISGDAAIAGAYRDDDGGTDTGSAYLFERASGNWSQRAKLMASDRYASDYFGRSVFIDGNTAIVGCYRDDDTGTDSGSAYLFEKPAGGWISATESVNLAAYDGAAGDALGFAVGISNGLSIIGAVNDDDRGADSGSAYVFGSRGPLRVEAELPPQDFIVSGLEEGPFAPLAKTYIVRNAGSEPLNWTAAGEPNWLAVMPTSGSLDPGSSTLIEVTISAAHISGFAQGIHYGTFAVIDVTNHGRISKTVTLNVIEIPGTLEVTDSIPEPNMPFGDVIVSLSKAERLTITNTDPNPRHEVVIHGVSVDNMFTFYEEDFADGLAQDWRPSPLAYWQIYNNDEYRADAYSDNYLLYLQSLYSGRTFKDGFVEVAFRCQYYSSSYGDDNSAGIILRASDDFDLLSGQGSAYLVYVRGDQYFRIVRCIDGAFTDIQSMGWVYSPLLNFGTSENRIRAVFDDEQFELYINNSAEPVWTGTDSAIADAGFIGLFGQRASSTSSRDTYFFFDQVTVGSNDVFTLSIPEDDYPIVIAGGQSLVVDVNFAPVDFVDYSAEIVIESSDPNNEEILIPVSGTGIPEYLVVTGEPEQFTGHPGGPFMPSSTTCTIENTGPVSAEWRLVKPLWLEIVPSSGWLEPGQSVVLTIEPNEIAGSMPDGIYQERLTICDLTTTVAQQVDMSLVVYSLGKIYVNPAAINLTVPQGTTVTGALAIGNSGDANVNYTLFESIYWLTLSQDSGTVAPDRTDQILLTLDGTGATGTYGGVIQLQSNDPYNSVINVPVNITVEGVDDYVELFESGGNDLANCSLTLTPDGSGSHYQVCRNAATEFPINPADGLPVSLKDDDYAEITLNNASISFYGSNYTVFYVGSNGYITFGSGDFRYHENIEEHFELPRIAALFDDLDPSAAGAGVSWKQLADRVVVTFENVPEMGLTNSNSFQVEMFFNGKIRITWLEIASDDGLAGLSQGNGIPVYYEESDLSAYPECIPMTGDLNKDLHIDLNDFAMFSQYWGRVQPLLKTVSDQFNAVSYGGNDGTVNWTTGWGEYGEIDGPTAGILQVTPDGAMRMGQKGIKLKFDWSLTRQADLSNATEATLSYDYTIDDKAKSGIVYVQLSTNGGLNWYTLAAHPYTSGSGSISYDISDWISDRTQIRFSADPAILLDMLFDVNDIQIEFGNPDLPWYDWCNGSDTNMDFAVDLQDLIPIFENWLE